MTADVFRRLALLAGATAYVVALCLVGLYVAWAIAVVAAVGGPVVALLLTVEASPTVDRPAEPEYPAGTLVERDGKLGPLRRGRMPDPADGS